MTTHDLASHQTVLDVRNLSVRVGRSDALAVDDVSLRVDRGERVGLVGESGSGKSVTAMSIARLISHRGGAIAPDSQIRLNGLELTSLPEREMREVRAQHIGMVFQDPLSSLNPVFTVGNQIAESVRSADPSSSRKAAARRAVELLGHVGIADPGRAVDAYPHQFSGGMRQRVMIAIALACDPKLLIADEPTTALDVTIQAQILDLLDRLVSEHDLSVLLITHDLGIVAGFTDRLYVMYSGKIIETGTTEDVFAAQGHPYTRGLIQSVPRLEQPRDSRLHGIAGSPPALLQRPAGCSFHPRCPLSDDDACITRMPGLAHTPGGATEARCHHSAELLVSPESLFALDDKPGSAVKPSNVAALNATPVLEIEALVKEYAGTGMSGKSRGKRAVDTVDLTLARGETLGLVGESGSGKSTIARCALRLEKPTGGVVRINGLDVTNLAARQMRGLRQKAQMVFQDPYASFDPRRPIGSSLAEPLKIHGLWESETGHEQLRELMSTVTLDPADLSKYPHEFSGGQLQRIAIARALTLEPDLIVFDEPVSSLDVSTQAEVITLLEDLQDQSGMAYLFIAHDLSIVRHISDRIAVVHDGEIVEVGTSDQVCHSPQHPYTKKLLSAVPIPEPSVERSRRLARIS